MPLWPWIERRFTFDFPVGKYPDLVERMRGLPARAEDRVRGLTRKQLTWSDGGWSIQANLGHLLSLEALFDGRIEDFLAGKPELRAADMENRATHEARYDEREVGSILVELRAARMRQVARLAELKEADFARVSVHPRLKQPLRLVDAVCFVCEHDDYHMARVAELCRGQGIVP
jgi:uncharacterized damage-inducible protein DinB